MPKNILITGAKANFGYEAAIALEKKGHFIYATTHKQEDADRLNIYAKENKLKLEAFALDITNENDRQKIRNLKIDVLINNAAIGQSGALSEIPLENVKRNFETNVFGSLRISQIALEQMIKRDSGTVIFVSSLAGRLPIPYLGAYSMSKFCLSSMAAIMRQEMKDLSKKIHISVVEPGAYYTGFNQKNLSTKDDWMGMNSYYWSIKDKLKDRDDLMFRLLESKDLSSIVKKIVKAAESNKPKLRYTAPWWQAYGAQLLRIFGI